MSYYDREPRRSFKEAFMDNPLVRLGAGLIAIGMGGAGVYVETMTPAAQKTIEDPLFLLLTGSVFLAGLGLTAEGIVRSIGAVFNHLPGRRRRR